MTAGPNSSAGRISKKATHSRPFNESNIAALERELDAPNGQLQHQRETHPRLAHAAPPKTLNDEQEKDLIKWIRRVKEISTHPTATQITTSADQILNRDGNNTTISKAWVDRFIKRLPDDLKPSKERLRKKTRLDPSDRDKLQHWFDRLKSLIDGVSPANIYNFDETIFRIGEGTGPRWYVTARDNDSPPPFFDRTWTEWITTIECIAADGWAADPYIVFQGDYYLEDWFEVEGIPDQYTFNTNPSGRITEKAASEWIQIFHRQTKDRVQDNQPRILLFRGLPQYLGFNFLQFCEQHQIIPVCFPPHIGHLMQPFDDKAFRSYKQYWKKKYYLCPPDDADDEKTDFMQKFFPVREEALKPQVIMDAFADKGIFPFDPSKMIESL